MVVFLAVMALTFNVAKVVFHLVFLLVIGLLFGSRLSFVMVLVVNWHFDLLNLFGVFAASEDA